MLLQPRTISINLQFGVICVIYRPGIVNHLANQLITLAYLTRLHCLRSKFLPSLRLSLPVYIKHVLDQLILFVPVFISFTLRPGCTYDLLET